MNQKSQKKRDILLALLSIGGIFYLVDRAYFGIIYLIMEITNFGIGVDGLKFLIFFESILLLINGLFIWKIVNLSKDYSRYFILFFVIVFILDLIYKFVTLVILIPIS